MSTRAVCIPFHRYQPHAGDYYHLYWDFFLSHLPIWANEFDALYIIDDEWGFTPQDLEKLQKIKPKSRIIVSTQQGHHWVQFKNTIPQIKEDKILFMDNDIVIFSSDPIRSWFEAAEKSDVVTAFDGSGGMVPQIHAMSPMMEKINASRMGSYYFILPQKVFSEIPDFDFAPVYYDPGVFIPELNYTTVKGDWLDSFGLFTIKMVSKNYTFTKIYDDRETIMYSSFRIQAPKISGNIGYYHIRNGNMPNLLLTSHKYHKWQTDYRKFLKDIPRDEILRQFAWWGYMEARAYRQTAYGKNGLNTYPELLEILQDLGIGEDDWKQYMMTFFRFHKV